jgi:hypothetical protein
VRVDDNGNRNDTVNEQWYFEHVEYFGARQNHSDVAVTRSQKKVELVEKA